MYCYRLLGLSPPCTEAEIKKAYKALALKYHPDKAGTSSEDRMKQLNAAYEEALSSVGISSVNINFDKPETSTSTPSSSTSPEARHDAPPEAAAVKISFSNLTADLTKSIRETIHNTETPIKDFLGYFETLGTSIDYAQPGLIRAKNSFGSKIENEIHQHICMLANDLNELLSQIQEYEVEAEQHLDLLKHTVGVRLGGILNMVKELMVYDMGEWTTAFRFSSGMNEDGMLRLTSDGYATRENMSWAHAMKSQIGAGWTTQQGSWSMYEVWLKGFEEEKVGRKYVR